MKKFISIFIVAILFLAACTKQESIVDDELGKDTKKAEQNLGKYQKELTIFDKSKENSVILKLWSNDETILKEWKESDFEIMVILNNESFDDAYNKKYQSNRIDSEINDEFQKDEKLEQITEPIISIMIIKKNMAKGVGNIALTFLSNSSNTKWDFPPALYSSEFKRNRTATIRGYKSLYRAYYGVDIKSESESAWTILASQWQQIKDGETHLQSSNCYQMRVWKKYRSSGAITVSFND